MQATSGKILLIWMQGVIECGLPLHVNLVSSYPEAKTGVHLICFLCVFFFPHNSIDVIVKNTNKFGNKLKSDKSNWWFWLTSKEFLAFLGIVIFMGLVKVPSLVEYCNDDGFFGQDFVLAPGN